MKQVNAKIAVIIQYIFPQYTICKMDLTSREPIIFYKIDTSHEK